jgi:hypothetical protein
VNSNAARRARQKAITPDLTQAYTDEEAAPPEWLDLLTHVRDETNALRADVQHETERFASEPDIRAALARRERIAASLRQRAGALNKTVSRLNLIAPHSRFTRAPLDVEQLLRSLYRTPRRAD